MHFSKADARRFAGSESEVARLRGCGQPRAQADGLDVPVTCRFKFFSQDFFSRSIKINFSNFLVGS